MHHRRIVASAIVACFALSTIAVGMAPYSDWIGVYTRVDKVVLEPNETAPERIQIWGAFALATKDDRNNYDPAARGYLYFSIRPGKEDVCRKEWADLKSIAGTGQVIGLGGRQQRPRIRKPEEKPADPEIYPVSYGLVKMGDRGVDYPPIRELKALPKK